MSDYIVTLNEPIEYDVSVQALDDGTVDGSMGASRTITINGQGVAGATGPAGPAGPTGAAGPTGSQGPAGNTGPQGIQGETGPAGPTGPQGAQGNTGPQGIQGETGPQGPQGNTGPQGPTGNTGPQGIQGETGPAGAAANTGSIIYTNTSITTVGNVAVTFGTDVQIDGDLTVNGNTVSISVTNLAVEDNMIYLNDGSANANPDLGFVGNYNDGTYRHAGFFRDATDGKFKVFDNYEPEPDGAFIDTSNSSFHLADFVANAVSFTTLTATGQTSLGGAAGAEGLRVLTPIAAAGLRLQVGVPGSTVVRLGPAGAAVADFRILAPTFTNFYTGSSSDGLTDGAAQMRVSHTASAVNYVQVTGAATGGSPVISAQGSDANVPIEVNAKGTGTVTFRAGTSALLNAIPNAGGDTWLSLNRLTGGVGLSAASGVAANAAFIIQSKGTGAIDLAAGSSGVNISNGGTVTAITRTATGSGYTSIPSVAITAPTTAGGVQATATATMFAATATIQAGGTGYTVNDVLTTVGGTFSGAASWTVTSVSGGVVTGISLSSGGSGYSVLPTNPVSTTGGTGTDCTLNITSWGLSTTFTFTNAGSGYVEQPTVTFSGGGGSGAAAYATVGSVSIIKALGVTGVAAFDFHTPASATNSAPVLRLRDVSTTPGNTGFIQIQNNTGYTQIVAQGPADAGLNIACNGGGRINFNSQSTQEVTQMRIVNTTSAVNFVQVTGAATGGGPTISMQGSDTNINMSLTAKGSGIVFIGGQSSSSSSTVRLAPSGGNALFASATNTSINYVMVSGAATGISPAIIARGTDANVGLRIGTLNNANIDFYASGDPNAGTGVIQARISATANAVNYVQVTGAATGSAPTISAQGSDTNTNLTFQSKGTFGFTFRNSSSGTVASITHSGSSTPNYLQLASTVSGSAPTLNAQGTDTNVDLNLSAKGTGAVNMNTGNGTAFKAVDVGVSAANWIAARGAGTGGATILYTGGTDTDVNLVFGAKGAGLLRFSTARDNAGNQGADQFRITHTTSAVNYLQATGSATGGAVYLTAQGSDTNVPIVVQSKGTQPVYVATGGGIQWAALNTANSVNYAYAKGGAAGSGATIAVQGSDTNIDLNVTSKGTGSVVLNTGNGIGFKVADTGSTAVNYLAAINQATGNGPRLRADGADANVNLVFSSKGTGSILFFTNTEANRQFNISHTASAVNYVQVTGAATGGRPTISPQGSDTNIDLQLTGKGSGAVNVAFYQRIGSSYANYAQISGAASGSSPSFSSVGTDTNIDLNLTPKGTGYVTITANGLKFPDGTTQNTASSGGGATNYFSGLQILEDVYTAVGAQNIIFGSTDGSVSITRNFNALDFKLPTANTTALGGVKVDGSTITIANGVISGASLTTLSQSLTGNGSNTVFTLSQSTTQDNVLVHVDNVYHHPGDTYTVSNTDLTFTSPPSSGAAIRIRIFNATPISGGGGTPIYEGFGLIQDNGYGNVGLSKGSIGGYGMLMGTPEVIAFIQHTGFDDTTNIMVIQGSTYGLNVTDMDIDGHTAISMTSGAVTLSTTTPPVNMGGTYLKFTFPGDPFGIVAAAGTSKSFSISLA